MRFLICVLITCLAMGVKAQPGKDSTRKFIPEHIFELVTDDPEFYGGFDAWVKYLNTSIDYPEKAIEQNIQGTVYVKAVIRSSGKITDVVVFKGVHPLLDSVAVQVVRSSPDWRPGRLNGDTVNVRMTIPIKFLLSGGRRASKMDEALEALKRGFPDPPDMPDTVETNPAARYPGGYFAMIEFIRAKQTYPYYAKKQYIEGTVNISATVDTTGKLQNLQVQNGVNGLNEEALRIVKIMPLWTPAKKDGKPVESKVSIHVSFYLPNDEKK